VLVRVSRGDKSLQNGSNEVLTSYGREKEEEAEVSDGRTDANRSKGRTRVEVAQLLPVSET